MTDDLVQAVTKAMDQARLLDTATDHLTEALTDVEAAIKGLQLRVSAKVWLFEVSVGEGEKNLCWSKHDNAWGLVYETAAEWMPLHNAPRSIRLQACKRLRALIDALCAAVGVEIAKVQEAIFSCEQLTSEVREFVAAEKANEAVAKLRKGK